MIASVRGPLLRQGAGFVILEINGMGMRVEVPSGARAPRVHADEVFLHTSLIVREDSMTLFGFETLDEITVFEHMITVSGVGPKSALGVLSALTPAEIARAVVDENDKAFRQAPGIGPKTSKLLIVSLAGKLDNLTQLAQTPAAEPDSVAQHTRQVVLGLQGLGWREEQAQQAVQAVRSTDEAHDAAVLMRAALQWLQSGGANQ